MLKRYAGFLRIYKVTPFIALISLPLCFLLGILVTGLICWADNEVVTWNTLGTLFYIFILACTLYISCQDYPRDIMLALSFGYTRREYLTSFAITRLLLVGLAYILLILMCWLESVFYPALFPQLLQVSSLLPILTDWRVALISISALVIVPMFFGALYARFGKPMGMILYFLWIGCCMLLPRLAEGLDTGLLVCLLSIPPVVWCLLGIFALAAMAVVTVRLNMKQSVR